MPLVQPPAPRYVIDQHGDLVRVIIPSRKHWLAFFFSSLLLVMTVPLWLMIGNSLLAIVYRLLLGTNAPGDTFDWFEPILYIPMLAMFGYVSGVSAWVLLWQLSGSELIGFTSQSLTLSRRILGFQRPKEYVTEHIVNLRVTPPNSARPMQEWLAIYSHLFGVEAGTLTFDYGSSRVHFAAGINELEAHKLITDVQQRLPRYRNIIQSSVS